MATKSKQAIVDEQRERDMAKYAVGHGNNIAIHEDLLEARTHARQIASTMPGTEWQDYYMGPVFDMDRFRAKHPHAVIEEVDRQDD